MLQAVPMTRRVSLEVIGDDLCKYCTTDGLQRGLSIHFHLALKTQGRERNFHEGSLSQIWKGLEPDLDTKSHCS